MKKELIVTGMSCNGCVRHVTKALEEIEGVNAVSVDLESGLTEVSSDIEIPEAVLISAVEASGYNVQN